MHLSFGRILRVGGKGEAAAVVPFLEQVGNAGLMEGSRAIGQSGDRAASVSTTNDLLTHLIWASVSGSQAKHARVANRNSHLDSSHACRNPRVLGNGLGVEVHQLLAYNVPAAALDLLECCGRKGRTFGVVTDEVHGVIRIWSRLPGA